jgi:transposase InsO family protein
MNCCSTQAAETMLQIAADPKHLGARIGITTVLHAWGSWKDDYNNVRPHSALANLPPITYAQRSVPVMQRDGIAAQR